MKQGPLFNRKFFVQRAPPGVPTTEAGSSCMYIRLHGSPENPGLTLNAQRLTLAPGGVLDVLSLSHGGEGVGRVAYTPGLLAAIKRSEDHVTYRFEVPETASPGTVYQVACYGHDATPSFRFAIAVPGQPG